jgi:hypothetical protein
MSKKKKLTIGIATCLLLAMSILVIYKVTGDGSLKGQSEVLREKKTQPVDKH